MQLKEDLTFDLPIVKIVDKGTKQLRNKSIPLVKVAWVNRNSEEFTWEFEEDMKRNYLELFRGNKFLGKIFIRRGEM